MKLKFLAYLLFTATFLSCGGNKTTTVGYVGKTYFQPEELGLTENFGIMLSYDQVTEEYNRESLSLVFMYEDPQELSNTGKHVFLCRHSDDNSKKTILAELDIDRETCDLYDFAMVSFTKDGERLVREYLVRTDPQGTFKEIYLLDLKNYTFVPTEPYGDMEFEWEGC